MSFLSHPISQLPTTTPCLILGVFTQSKVSAAMSLLDAATQSSIQNMLAQGDITGKVGQNTLLYGAAGSAVTRVLLVGCGDEKGISLQDFYKLQRSIASSLKQTKTTSAVYALDALKIGERSHAWQIQQSLTTIRDELYSFTQFKSKTEETPTFTQLDFLVPENEHAQIKSVIATGNIIAECVSQTRDLAYLPPNICTPAYLADQAKELAKAVSTVQVEVLEREDMQALKMGALLAVSQGSLQAPKLVILQYHGGSEQQKPVVLVGKGVTFDTGGINLKLSANIVGMKFDMCGAATVLATIKAAALLKLPINIVGIMVCVENMIGRHAYRPDDVITSMSGQTIEVNNTDAEGRLILCDALTYCAKFQPDVVIDIATLTGAVITALGKHATGLFSNDTALAQALTAAGQESGDRVWELPLWEEYQQQLDSSIADMQNTGPGGANSITAACFLARFTKNYRWAHLDIAGTAFITGNKALATGRPVPLLVQFLMQKAK